MLNQIWSGVSNLHYLGILSIYGNLVSVYVIFKGVVPGPIREIASDLYRVLLGENLVREMLTNPGGRYGETTAS